MISLISFRASSRSATRPALRRMASRIGIVILLLAVSGGLRAAPKAPGSEPDGPTPVEVTNLVDVIGSVEVVREPHKQPFWFSTSGTVTGPYANDVKPIPLPEGKRVVIETVTVWTKVGTGGRAMGYLSLASRHVGVSGQTVFLTFTDQGAWSGGTLFTVTAPITLRINTNDWNLSLYQFRSFGSGDATYNVTLAGYIEDL